MKITVTFTSQGRLLEAAYFIPTSSDDGKKYPALLFEGSVTGATSQVVERLAADISEEGFCCLVMDHSFYGDDEASPLPWESPAKRVEDIKAGFQFLVKQEDVDRNRIAAVGVSVGAEYLARAIHETKDCKGLIMVEGSFDDSQNFVKDLEVPSIVVDENNLLAAVDQSIIWLRSLFNPELMNKGSEKVDWSVSDK